MASTQANDNLDAIPLPVSIDIPETPVRLADVCSESECRKQGRPCLLRESAGSEGRLMLGESPLCKVRIDENAKKAMFLGDNAKEKLNAALKEPFLELLITAGAGTLQPQALLTAETGDIIALDLDVAAALPIRIAGTSFCLGDGELMQAEAQFWVRIVSREIHEYHAPNKAGMAVGEVVLGRISLSPAEAAGLAEGSLLGPIGPPSPHTFVIFGQSFFRGYLQCFQRDDLESHPRLRNDLPPGDADIVTAFMITASNAPPAAQAFPSRNRRSAEPVIAPDAFCSVITHERAMRILATLDDSCAAWFLKSPAPSSRVALLLRDLCLHKGMKNGSKFLAQWVRCTPQKTPRAISRILLDHIGRKLDRHEFELALEERISDRPQPVHADAPSRRAAHVMGYLSDDDNRALLHCLAATDSAAERRLRSCLFFFEDIGQLSDRQIQTLLQELDPGELSVACSGNEAFLAALIDRLAHNMSKRAGDIFHEEIRFASSSPEMHRRECREKIVSVIRRMEENGSLTIEQAS